MQCHNPPVMLWLWEGLTVYFPACVLHPFPHKIHGGWENISSSCPPGRQRYTLMDGYISKSQTTLEVSYISTGVTLHSPNAGYNVEDSLQWMDSLAQNTTSVFCAVLYFPWCNFVWRLPLRSSVTEWWTWLWSYLSHLNLSESGTLAIKLY